MELTNQPSPERLRYLSYCKNPFRNDEIVSGEFDELLAIPAVTHVAFHTDDNILMIGTSLISISNPDTGGLHDIGEFIIYLYRSREGRIWNTAFCFQNTHGLVEHYHHPHISKANLTGVGEVGMLCIQRGQFHIYQHLRNGEIPTAVNLLIEILKTYTKSGPFKALESWPERKQS
jgi:hypothetical protein